MAKQLSSPLKVDRLKQILDLVTSKKRVALSELESLLAVSRITIQRHLVELESRGLLKRFHGGAMSIDFSQNLTDHAIRKSINVEAKKALAAKAVSLIKPGMYVGLDASSTADYLSEQILPSGITIVTCGVDAFLNLSKMSDVNPILSGGRLNRATSNLSGPEAVDIIKKFHYDIAFISVEWLNPARGFFDLYDDEVQVKQALMAAASRVAMLVDQSKVAEKGGVRVCGIDDVSYLITDDPANKQLKNLFKEKLL